MNMKRIVKENPQESEILYTDVDRLKHTVVGKIDVNLVMARPDSYSSEQYRFVVVPTIQENLNSYPTFPTFNDLLYQYIDKDLYAFDSWQEGFLWLVSQDMGGIDHLSFTKGRFTYSEWGYETEEPLDEEEDYNFVESSFMDDLYEESAKQLAELIDEDILNEYMKEENTNSFTEALPPEEIIDHKFPLLSSTDLFDFDNDLLELTRFISPTHSRKQLIINKKPNLRKYYKL